MDSHSWLLQQKLTSVVVFFFSPQTIAGNGLNGVIPLELGYLTFLTSLDLTRNLLTGPVPDFLDTSLSNLRRINLREAGLQGTIPPGLGDLNNLLRLDLGNNDLSGTLPSELGQLERVQILYLSDNNLSGTIPQSFTNVGRLAVDVNGNDADGT